MPVPHFDVLIVGAGVSGIGAACHLTRECPGKSYVVLERREQLGGTWDLFRYPGIRSDSDMFTFGFSFRPWNEPRVLADGPSIQRYVAATAAEYGVDQHIRYRMKVLKASWSSGDGRWTVEARNEATGRKQRFTAGYLIAGTGYYDYDQGYRPQFPGEDRFGGQLIHPQHWPADLDYAGQRVLIIGSGATAITLVPAMAAEAAHVTMLQRSPTYIMSLPAEDKISEALRRFLPEDVVWRMARRRNIGLQRGLYKLSRRRPGVVRKLMLRGVRRQLGGASDLANFTPSYDPWDQRLCVVPDGDLFRTIRQGRADVVTGRIETFTETGVRLTSGEEITADVIVAATGLQVQLLGGAALEIDGEPVPVNQLVTYKGVLLEGVPNASIIFGYTNASWTLKADIAAEYTCRLLNYLDRHGYTQAVAHASDADRGDDSVMGALDAGYVRRGNDRLPRQGTRGPWKVRNDYVRDAPVLRMGPINDGILQFSRGAVAEPDDSSTGAHASAGR
jgi:monooxygenase